MDKIIIKGAKENNLKNINLEIPRDKLVVFTGVSGSGKSTLAFDTIFAEGQRRYVESLSSYARQFLGQMQKPNVESIEGLSPAISIDQKTTNNNPRSTVGTVTEIYDYFRLLFARIGVAYCPKCGHKIESQTIDQIIDSVLMLAKDTKIMIEAPIIDGQKGTHEKILNNLRSSGYARVEIDGEVYTLDDDINLDKNKKHNINVIIDRLIIKDEIEKRLSESCETALNLADGKVIIKSDYETKLYSTKYSCTKCNISLGEITPRIFSFNTPYGACPECDGLGFKQSIDENLIVTNPNLSLNEGALNINGWNLNTAKITQSYFKGLSEKYKFSLDSPFKDLSSDVKKIILYGSKGEKIKFEYENEYRSFSNLQSFEGVIPNLQRRFLETTSEFQRMEISKLMSSIPCPLCKGKRLKQEALSIKIDSLNIAEICDFSVDKIFDFLSKLKLTSMNYQIAEPILHEINSRLKFLKNVGLGYLTLSRTAGTLSGGESQRIRLASQIGSGLTGVLYILDEPSIGLHQRDNAKLIETLKNLRDLGNSIIVVEHDDDTIKSADFIVDIGPLAGVNGGELIVAGDLNDLKNCEKSITSQYLFDKRKIEIPEVRRKIDGNHLKLYGCKQNNLKNIDVSIPLNVLTLITGVSGGGKSSLITETLYPALSNILNRSRITEGLYDKIEGTEFCDKVIMIDQNPIGRTPRSNPATYTGIFSHVRDLFAETLDAKERGYKAGRFSFNISGGRCEHCEGGGIKKIEMYFLPDLYVPCEVCKGRRYNRETLEVKFKGKSISDILEMTVEDALYFFKNFPNIKNKIQTLFDVGLGYIKLGQSATTLSGGEAQRIKLATELSKKSTGKTIYILDEPTTGLSKYDVDKLIKILQRFVSAGNTVIVIEHNLDVIKVADYIIDLGPEGGDKGGEIVVEGTPEKVAKNKSSYTGQFLKEVLKDS
ncbi:MAG: excinuclease ABC subunit UvrA [Bacilli bacterium]